MTHFTKKGEQMKNHDICISVVVPFYKGNRYIDELLTNIGQAAQQMQLKYGAGMEVIIINDSPDVPVDYSVTPELQVRVIANEQNLGIHGSRIHGVNVAKGEYIQFLDQDDLLLPENYPLQYEAVQGFDAVVGNAYYDRDEKTQLLYPNRSVMNYYIQQTRFVKIRDLIASPGHCLIRKDAIPTYWLENPMYINGADDFYLWMLMFNASARFAIQDKPVYVHRNSVEGNLSFDLERMQKSNTEMCELLQKAPHYPVKKQNALRRSINFKYLYDTHRLKPLDWLRYIDKVFDNGIYKVITLILRIFR